MKEKTGETQENKVKEDTKKEVQDEKANPEANDNQNIKGEENGCALDIEKMSEKELKILANALMVENTEIEKQLRETLAERDKLKKTAEKAGELSAMYSAVSRDFDVYRKRNAEIEATSKDKAITETGIKIIPVFDNLRRAVESTADEKVKEGINLIYRQFGDVLKSLGITEFAEEGDVFDPYKHNALMAAEADKEEFKGRIKQVFSKGYIYKDKVIKQGQVLVYK